MFLAALLVVSACAGKKAADPCDAKAIAGVGATAGKSLAFDGCTFQGQGNDVVSFGDATGKGSIDCKMKGGAAAVESFRHAAMEIGQSKLKLDVRGVSAKDGMTDCEISTHQ